MPYPKVFDLTVKQLMDRFPKGFVVNPSGEVYAIIEAKKRPQDLPILLSPGGYLAVVMPELKAGDDYYGQNGEGVFMKLTPSEMADELDRLIKLADTLEEDEILSKLYKTYSEKLDYAAKELLKENV